MNQNPVHIMLFVAFLFIYGRTFYTDLEVVLVFITI